MALDHAFLTARRRVLCHAHDVVAEHICAQLVLDAVDAHDLLVEPVLTERLGPQPHQLLLGEPVLLAQQRRHRFHAAGEFAAVFQHGKVMVTHVQLVGQKLRLVRPPRALGG